MDDTWVIVAPDYLDLGDTARILLELARDPSHVRTQGNGNEFAVPPYLADLYNAPVAAPAPAPKRRRNSKEGDE